MTTKQPLLLLLLMMTLIMTCLFTVIIQWRDIFIRQDVPNLQQIIFVADHHFDI
jgi:hypothetical protein